MRAIARSDGTRASVLRELRASEVNDGILGSFRFDANGDITTASIPILRITGATPPGAGLPPELPGSDARSRRAGADKARRMSGRPGATDDRVEIHSPRTAAQHPFHPHGAGPSA